MTYLNLIQNKVKEEKENIIECLQQLIREKSVGAGSLPGMPFGEGVDNAFKFMLSKGNLDGFETVNVDNMGGHIEYGHGKEILGVLGHLDVVPEGDGWKFDPYGGVIDDGKLYGRGAVDNKGPVVASYYALKILKDLGITPNKRIRIILGLDEETNWKGVKHYFLNEERPTIGFTPDSDFPVVNREMGILVFALAKKFPKPFGKGISLRSVRGGNAPNMVPDSARAVVTADKKEVYLDIKAKAASYRERGIKIKCKGIGKSLEITSIGVSAHGANPSAGVNAIGQLFGFLAEIEFNNEGVNEFIDFYNAHIGMETDGSSLGIAMEDQVSGKLILNVGMIELDPKSVELSVNVRYPVTLNDQAVYGEMEELLTKFNIGVVKYKHQLPVFLSDDEPLVKILMDVYKDHTGDLEAKPLAIGGGTYARACENVLAFGPCFPGEPEVEHQPNEYIEIENLLKLVEIYADAIYRLACC